MVVDLEYVESGAGTPVVLLHAFPLSAQMWTRAHRDLADGPDGRASMRLVTPDLRGQGRSPLGFAPLGADVPSVDLMADDVAALLDRLGLGTVVLGGLSMGGYVVMSFLRRYADRVRAVVLADTKAAADTQEAAANRRRIADVLEAERTPRVLVEKVLPKLCGPTTLDRRPEVYDEVRLLVEAVPPEGAAWAQRAMAARPDSYDVLRGVAVPTLVLVGAEEGLTPPAEAEAMAGAIPRAELVVVDGCGHLSALEVPATFNQVLRDFVARLDRPAQG